MKRSTNKTGTAKLALTVGAIAAGFTLSAVVPAMSVGNGGGERPVIEFNAVDQDGNGEITQEEFTAFHAVRKAERFAMTDTNSDGLLSAEEIEQAASERAAQRSARMIERFDENDDGMLSMDELPEGGEGRRGKRGGHGQGGQSGNRQGFIERFDADGNGTISSTEFEAAKQHMQSRRGGRGQGGHHSN